MANSQKDLFVPSATILNNYAKILVNYALNSGAGVKAKEVVNIVVPDVSKPLAKELHKEVLKAGAYPLLQLLPTEFDKDFYQYAKEDQLTFFPKKYLKAKANLIDHQIGILADVDPFELKDVDPQKIIKARDSKKNYRDWLTKKENDGKFTWTLALWASPAKAKEVGLSLEDYWQQIILACYLDLADPISKWQQISRDQKRIRQALNDLKIERVHVLGEQTDIWLTIGANRIWNGGGGRNIPSFEIFTSPDWRGTEGRIRFNEPLYRYGNLIADIDLVFKRGKVVEAKAKKGNKFLQAMLKSKNADKLGEFSLTDGRMSRITHAMAETLFDENMGGKFGNMHLAIGKSYQDCYRGDFSKVSKKEWKDFGFNDSAEHTDIVQTTDRTVTAILQDGSEKIIYQKGQFKV